MLSCAATILQRRRPRWDVLPFFATIEKSWIGPDRRPRPRAASAARPRAGDQFIVMMMSKPMVCQVMYRPVTRSDSIGLYSILLIIALIHSPGCTGAYAGPGITMPAPVFGLACPLWALIWVISAPYTIAPDGRETEFLHLGTRSSFGSGVLGGILA